MNDFDKQFYTIIGEMLRQLRTESGKTLKEVASALGVTDKTIQRYELGERKIATQNLKNAVEFLGGNYESFVNTAQRKQLGEEITSRPAVANDEFTANDPSEKDLLVLFREAGQNQAEKQRLVKLFESTIDVFMEAKGIDPNKPDED